MSYLESRDAKREITPIKINSEKSINQHQAKSYIDNIDFSMLIHKISLPDENISRVWSPESAEIAVNYYRNFLWLVRKYGDQETLAPSTEIDEIWHHHILDTQKYHEDCNAIFGTYLHHYPYFGMRGEQDSQALTSAFSRTQALHYTEFGEYIMSFEEEMVEIHALPKP